MRQLKRFAIAVCAVIVGMYGASTYGQEKKTEELKVAEIFGNSMVLQRDMEVPVWGWAENGETITVEFNGCVKTAVAGQDGRWTLKIGPFAAGGPYYMKIKGKATRTISDIMVGEVWLCSGQSNMQWPLEKMENAEEEIAGANNPNIRIVTVRGGATLEQKKDLSPEWISCKWTRCHPSTAKTFSAPGYFFGRELYKSLNVPIGIISTAEGSSPLRSWISPETQKSNPLFKAVLEDYSTYAERKKPYNAYLEALKKAKAEGTKEPPFPGHFEAYGDGPGMFYNSRVYPLAPFAIKGVVWWQGENEAMYKHADSYKDLFPILIEDWRRLWGQGDFPFLFVQLQPIGSPAKDPGESDWAEVRDGQRRTLKVKNTGMVVTTDICDAALHPIRKAELGKRLAAVARSIAYGEKLVCSGPIFDKAEFKDGKAYLSFSNVGGGLVAKGERLLGFSIAGADNKFVRAEAEIIQDKVLVNSDKVPVPQTVRYAWDNNPAGNLFNKEGLPASCFQSGE
ncbi:MAG: sialate O-acetylesterase [Victivallales bacterium]